MTASWASVPLSSADFESMSYNCDCHVLTVRRDPAKLVADIVDANPTALPALLRKLRPGIAEILAGLLRGDPNGDSVVAEVARMVRDEGRKAQEEARQAAKQELNLLGSRLSELRASVYSCTCKLSDLEDSSRKHGERLDAADRQISESGKSLEAWVRKYYAPLSSLSAYQKKEAGADLSGTAALTASLWPRITPLIQAQVDSKVSELRSRVATLERQDEWGKRRPHGSQGSPGLHGTSMSALAQQVAPYVAKDVSKTVQSLNTMVQRATTILERFQRSVGQYDESVDSLNEQISQCSEWVSHLRSQQATLETVSSRIESLITNAAGARAALESETAAARAQVSALSAARASAGPRQPGAPAGSPGPSKARGAPGDSGRSAVSGHSCAQNFTPLGSVPPPKVVVHKSNSQTPPAKPASPAVRPPPDPDPQPGQGNRRRVPRNEVTGEPGALNYTT